MKFSVLKRLPTAGCTIFVVVLLLGVAFSGAQEQSGRSGAANRTVGSLIPPSLIPSGLDQEIKRVEREVDQIEQQAMAEWKALPIDPSTRMKQVQVLGKLLLFDKNLSV